MEEIAMPLAYLENPCPSLGRDGLLHALFEATARRSPRAPAVSCGS